MPIQETSAYVLRTYTLSDSDKICLLLTKDFGKVRAVAKGARRVRSRFGGSLEPLSEVQISFFGKEHQELTRLNRCELTQSNFDWSSSPEGEAASHYIAELVDQFLPPHEANPTVYRLLTAVTGCLRNSEKFGAVLTYFEIWLLKLSGFLPALDRCSSCGTPFAEGEAVRIQIQGAALCESCGEATAGTIVDSKVRHEVLAALRLPPQTWVDTQPGGATVRNFRALLQEIIRYVLEKEPKAQRFVNFTELAT